MESSLFTLSLVAAFLPFLIIALPIDESSSTDEEKRPFNSKAKPFSGGLHNHIGLQSWNNWLEKRQFGDDSFGQAKLQSWDDWVKKRGLIMSRNSPRFGEEFGKNPALQTWDSWWQKRGFDVNRGGVLEGPAPMNKFGLQNWNNWVRKRGRGGLSDDQARTQMFRDFYNGNLQTWDEFAKKADFGKQQDILGFGRLQPWHMYSKRFGGSGDPFSSFDPHKNLMKWDEMVKRGTDEKRRPFDSRPRFGDNNYFNNGLQDWRHNQKYKRSSANAKISKQESN